MKTINITLNDGKQVQVNAWFFTLTIDGHKMELAAHLDLRQFSKLPGVKKASLWNVTDPESGFSICAGMGRKADAINRAREILTFQGCARYQSAVRTAKEKLK